MYFIFTTNATYATNFFFVVEFLSQINSLTKSTMFWKVLLLAYELSNTLPEDLLDPGYLRLMSSDSVQGFRAFTQVSH